MLMSGFHNFRTLIPSETYSGDEYMWIMDEDGGQEKKREMLCELLKEAVILFKPCITLP